MIETATQTIVDFAATVGLPVLLLTFYLKGSLVGKPIPTSIVLPGYVIATQASVTEGIWIAILCSAASVLGELTVYYGLQKQDMEFLNQIPYVTIPETQLQFVTEKFRAHGGISILIGSIIPGVRGTILIPAALSSYPGHRAGIASFIGTQTYHISLVLAALGVMELM